MRKVRSREFKNRMGQYLREVRRGRSLVTTDRGTPVAKVLPPDESKPEQSGLTERLKELESQGLIHLAKRPLGKFRAVPSRGKSASQMIIEEGSALPRFL
jgi:prevent-host-death family protein